MRPAKLFFISVVLMLFPGGFPTADPGRAFAEDGLMLEYNYIEDTNDRTYHDKSLRLDYKKVYAVGYLGNWQKGGEAGGYFNDSRRSAYSGYVRIREDDQSYQLGTDQVLKNGFVGNLRVRYIHVDEPEEAGDKDDLVVFGGGMEKYYGDYHYFSAMVFNDPREGGRFSFVLSNTLATKNSFLRLGFVPRNDGTQGYFGLVRYHWLYAGYSFTREFDYARFNRRVLTLAVKFPFDMEWTRKD